MADFLGRLVAELGPELVVGEVALDRFLQPPALLRNRQRGDRPVVGPRELRATD
jgi:hypothetical protein